MRTVPQQKESKAHSLVKQEPSFRFSQKLILILNLKNRPACPVHIAFSFEHYGEHIEEKDLHLHFTFIAIAIVVDVVRGALVVSKCWVVVTPDAKNAFNSANC